MPRLGAPLAVLALASALAVASAGAAEGDEDPATDPFVAVRDADPLELGRVTRARGDGAVLSRLADDRPVVVRLAAIRASRWMRAPEAALGRLAALAGGRDPDLAPAAARAAWHIARALDGPALHRREVIPADLAPARSTLQQLAADESARADLRRLAAFAADALSALGVPEPER